jgi:hypothetical protein
LADADGGASIEDRNWSGCNNQGGTTQRRAQRKNNVCVERRNLQLQPQKFTAVAAESHVAAEALPCAAFAIVQPPNVKNMPKNGYLKKKSAFW